MRTQKNRFMYLRFFSNFYFSCRKKHYIIRIYIPIQNNIGDGLHKCLTLLFVQVHLVKKQAYCCHLSFVNLCFRPYFTAVPFLFHIFCLCLSRRWFFFCSRFTLCVLVKYYYFVFRLNGGSACVPSRAQLWHTIQHYKLYYNTI